MVSILFQNLSDTFGLQITNNNMTDWENDWTVRSMVGEKRGIDFIMASRSLAVTESKSTKEIDLGSDHRAVKTHFDLGIVRYWGKSHTPKMKGWRPCLDHSLTKARRQRRRIDTTNQHMDISSQMDG